jgi:hypothetical protein
LQNCYTCFSESVNQDIALLGSSNSSALKRHNVCLRIPRSSRFHLGFHADTPAPFQPSAFYFIPDNQLAWARVHQKEDRQNKLPQPARLRVHRYPTIFWIESFSANRPPPTPSNATTTHRHHSKLPYKMQGEKHSQTRIHVHQVEAVLPWYALSTSGRLHMGSRRAAKRSQPIRW